MPELTSEFSFLQTAPRAPRYPNSRLPGYVTFGYIEPSSDYLGNWSPRVVNFPHIPIRV